MGVLPKQPSLIKEMPLSHVQFCRLYNPQLQDTYNHPSRAEEDDDPEDVDHTRGEDTVPCAEQHRLDDEEVGLPPRFTPRRLYQSTTDAN